MRKGILFSTVFGSTLISAIFLYCRKFLFIYDFDNYKIICIIRKILEIILINKKLFRRIIWEEKIENKKIIKI